MVMQVLVLLATFATFCYAQNELNVLFIGNSYTYVNDVPKLIGKLAQASGLTLHHDQHTEGKYIQI